MNILIVKLSAIGDVIHTLPSLTVLRKLYPDAHITWVVEEAAADLVRNHPYLNNILVSKRESWIKNIRNGEFSRPLLEVRLFLRELKARPYDMVIDFHGLLKSALIVFISGGKRKLGFDSMQELSGLFYNEKIPEEMDKHAVDRYLDFLRYLGAPIDRPNFVLPSESTVQDSVQSLMKKFHLEEKKFIAISPIAYWETKLWDNVKFARIADLIKTKLNLEVVLTGSEKESESIKEIISFMSTKGINLSGKTTLTELANLYREALIIITTDSGPMHLAAAVNTPVIALFGPTNPKRTGPYGQIHTIIMADLSCSPCLLKKCSTKECMQSILPEQVLAAIEEKLKEEI
jgi:heptosyltransferase-1